MKKILSAVLLLSALGSQLSTLQAQTNAAVIVETFGEGYCAVGATVAKVKVRVRNTGSEKITSLGYKVSNLSGESNEKTVKNLSIEPDETGMNGTYVDMNFTPGTAIGSEKQTVCITKVNGKTNEASATDATTSGTIYTYLKKLQRKTVQEEYTGTWCGYCPKGSVALEKLSEKYPDSYIGIAYHGPSSSDKYYTSESEPIASNFPEGALNRYKKLDVYYGSTGEPLGIESDYLVEESILPVAGVTAQASWVDEGKTQFSIKTDLEFAWPTENSLALAYVVTEDGMGPGYQTNYYGGSSAVADDPYFTKYYNGGSSVYTEFDHVAVAASGKANGIEGSVLTPAEAGSTQSYTYTFTLSDKAKSIIENKDKLSAVVMLLDRTQGKILNADKVEITGTTGIEVVPGGSMVVSGGSMYNVAGQRVAGTVKGINIKNGKKILK